MRYQSVSSISTLLSFTEAKKTEVEIGEAITSEVCPVSRSEIFLSSKQWRAYHGYDLTLACLDKSLQRLQTSYLDMWLIHWPGPAYNTMSRKNDLIEKEGPFVYAKTGHQEGDLKKLRAETWRAMEDAVYAGKIRAIGVSNFTVKHLMALKETARIWPPAINQIECHPYKPQRDIVEYCRAEGIVIEAYASLGGQDSGKKTWNKLGGKLLERKEVLMVAKKHNKTPGQVLLRWAAQQGHIVIPKSSQKQHMLENLKAVADHEWDNDGLDEEDMDKLNGLDQSDSENRGRLCWVRDPLKHLDFE